MSPMRLVPPREAHLTPPQRLMSQGLLLIMQYLNAGCTPHQLFRLKRDAQLWLNTYTHHTGFTFPSPPSEPEQQLLRQRQRQRLPVPVLRAHPDFWDLRRPSWDRVLTRFEHLPRGTPVPFTDTDTEDDGEGVMDLDCWGASARSKKMLLRDEEIYHMVDVLNREMLLSRRMPGERERDVYAEWRAAIRPGDLRGSPIVFFIPDIVAVMAELNPEEGMSLGSEYACRVVGDFSMMECCEALEAMDVTDETMVD
ncbi:hypothetical protein E4U55_005207 [Claviceps digitariae]|nr:hypothetical protein E4U55_005207 [Claviceps digitariae]